MKLFDVIEYLPPVEVKDEWLMYHYPGKEFNSLSKLRVQPGQVAIAVNSGKIEHIWAEDTGTVTLTTANYPFLSRLVANVAYGGKYPYDMQIYFLNSTAMKNFKWGTPAPLIIESKDPIEKGFIYHAISNGTFYLRLKYYQFFYSWISGSFSDNGLLCYKDILGKLKPFINQIVMDELSSYIDETQMSFSKVQRMVNEQNSQKMKERIAPKIEKIGFELNDFIIEMVTIPEEDQKKYEQLYAKRREFSTLSGLDQEAIAIQERQRQLDALNKAASNEGTVGGMMGAGLGFGYGMGMVNQVKGNSQIGGQPGTPSEQQPQAKPEIQVRCPKCGALNNETAKFCNQCGASLGPKACPKCGHQVPAGSKFCPECGTKIE
ncbi:MAG: SPFH domain-containing protein [Bacilli bacterium]